jgi:hypothetical protein
MMKGGFMKRIMTVFLALFITLNAVAALAGISDAEKIKSEITKHGTGEKARVRITTRDKVQLRGYISGVGESTFALTVKHPPQTRTLSYSDVVQVRGPGLNTAAKTAIGIGVGVAVGTGIAAAVIFAKCGNYCR